MKYLHDDGLAELTAVLTDCPVSNNARSNSRMLHGRLEAYITKRAGTDKKYAYALGNRYTAEQEAAEEDMATQLASIKKVRKRSVSTGEAPESSKYDKTGRARSNSLDLPLQRSSGAPVHLPLALSNNSTVNRRLLTDLILTLNHSFPDYDFATASALDFTVCPLQTVVQRINERLSELAVQRDDACFLSNLWMAVDKVIHLHQVSAVYSYQPATDCADPFSFLQQTLLQDSASATRQGTDTTADTLDVVVSDEDYYVNDEAVGGTTMDQAEGEVLWTFNYFFVNKHAKRILLFTCIETMRSCYNASTTSTIPEHEAVNHDRSFFRGIKETSYGVRTSTASVQTSDSDGVSCSRTRDDDDISSADSVDFDLDPADAVSGGIPIGTA